MAICDADLKLFDLLQHSLLLRDRQRFVLLTELQLPDFLVDFLVATHPQVAVLAAEIVPNLLLCRLLCPELLLPRLLLLLSLFLPARGKAGIQGWFTVACGRDSKERGLQVEALVLPVCFLSLTLLLVRLQDEFFVVDLSLQLSDCLPSVCQLRCNLAAFRLQQALSPELVR